MIVTETYMDVKRRRKSSSNGAQKQAASVPVPVVHQRLTFDGNMAIPEQERGTGCIFRASVMESSY